MSDTKDRSTIACPTCTQPNIAGSDACGSCMAPLTHAGLSRPRGSVRGRLMTDPIRSLDPRPPVTVPPDASVAQAAEAMRGNRTDCVLVTDGERLRGIFTERDLVRRVFGAGKDPATTLIRDVMTPDPSVLLDGDPITFALNRMSVGGFRHLPTLVSRDTLPTGIISVHNVLRYFAEITDVADATN